MPEDSKEQVEFLFAMTNSIALKRIKENVARELKFPENVNQIFKCLDDLKEEIKKKIEVRNEN